MLPTRDWTALCLAACLGTLTLLAHRVSLGQDELEAERPGLIVAFTAAGNPGDGTRGLAADFNGQWGAGSPDPRVPADGFSGRWEGLILIQAPGVHRFHVRSDGDVELKVAERVVQKGAAGSFQGEPIELPAGFAPIVLSYRHRQGRAHVAIDWEGPTFEREPVPARLLYHDSTKAPPPDRFEEGRQLADRLGCANCHRLLGLPAHPSLGPPLADAGRAIDPSWLREWLRDPARLRPGTRMPAFGHGFSTAEAADLAAFLEQAAPRTLAVTAEARMSLNVASATQGRLQFRSVGCLGCHTIGDAPSAPSPAIDLAGLSRKRSREWLAAFLGPPRSGRAILRHRHDLRLGVDEAAHLALYLAPEVPAAAATPLEPAGNAARGRTLAERARCASCHAIPGLKPRPIELTLAAGTPAGAGCLAETPSDTLVPRYALSAEQRTMLRAMVSGLPREPAPISPQTVALDIIRRLNCNGCHARDGRGGEDLGGRIARLLAEDPALQGLKGTLTPPNLTAVGDKLLADYLAKSIRAEAPAARPWLSVRMPAFAFEPGEADAIAAYFRGHDRMRSEADAPNRPARLDARATETAAQLVGQRGFGCISCHVLAGRIPPGGEPETLGPDLALAHRRMAERYFHRWIANPQRVIAGTPMPQFVKPIETIPGSLDDQLDLIWRLLGSGSLAEVAASGTREVLKRQGDRALVVRDMVLVPGAPGTEYTPRALAIGLKNDQSLLFDTDRLTWLTWWQAGFLSRTKSGRLWEWHPDGERLWVAPNRQPPVVFLRPDRSIVAPTEIRERFGSFTEVDFDGSALAFSYRLHAPDAAKVDVRERIVPTTKGWHREVTVTGVPDGWSAALLEHPPSADWSWTAGKSRVTLRPVDAELASDMKLPGDPQGRLLLMRPTPSGALHAGLEMLVAPLP